MFSSLAFIYFLSNSFSLVHSVQHLLDWLTENAGHEIAGHENTGHEFVRHDKCRMKIYYIT